MLALLPSARVFKQICPKLFWGLHPWKHLRNDWTHGIWCYGLADMGKAVQSKNSLIFKAFFNLTDSLIFFLPVLTWSVVAVSHGVNLPKTNPVNQPQQMFVQITSLLVWLFYSDQLPKDCSFSLEALCTSFAWSLWVVEGVWGLPRVHLQLPCKTTPATIKDSGCSLAPAVQHRHTLGLWK